MQVLGGDEGVMVLPKFRNMPFGKLMSQQKGRVGVLWNAVEVCVRALVGVRMYLYITPYVYT